MATIQKCRWSRCYNCGFSVYEEDSKVKDAWSKFSKCPKCGCSDKCESQEGFKRALKTPDDPGHTEWALYDTFSEAISSQISGK